MPKYYIGTSGWHYEDWRGLFYPADLPKSKWLEFYARHFSTVELNNSFYRLPSEKAFVNWREASPENFTFAVKVSRFITHIKRLKDVEEPLRNFWGRADLLGDKLGPLLYQLPPNMKRDDERLLNFLAILPGRYRHVFEFRHESWFDEGVFKILRRYNAGWCVFDMPKELPKWAKKIGDLGKSLKAVYVYFNNDVAGYAINNARTLIKILNTKP